MNYIDQHTIKTILEWEGRPDINVSYPTLKRVVFGLAKELQALHDAHAKGFQAGIEYQKTMENRK